jgi:hypothetical protein
MSTEDAKRYLAVIQFVSSTSVAELAKRVPGIRSLLAGICKDEMEQFFRSTEGNTFGLFFKSAKPLPVIDSILDGATTNADAFMVMEVGATHAAKGFGRSLTWLQRH